ncbi:MAG: MBL fold metallo-hydrolase [Thermoleophilia bacterium]
MTTISYVGHGTVHLDMDGVRLLTDPVLLMRIGWLQRHGVSPEPSIAQDLDAVLVSHLHMDHVNPATLRLVPRETPIVVPSGAGRLLRKYRFSNLHELAPGQTVRIGAVNVTATPAYHTGRRYPWGRFADAVGYTIHGSSTIYFAGDTGFFTGLDELADRIDVALLPIWGWGARLPDDHLSPETAARVLQLLRPRLAIPIHWGTFLPVGMRRLLASALVHPPQNFVRFAREYAPGVPVAVLQPGESSNLFEAIASSCLDVCR